MRFLLLKDPPHRDFRLPGLPRKTSCDETILNPWALGIVLSMFISVHLKNDAVPRWLEWAPSYRVKKISWNLTTGPAIFRSVPGNIIHVLSGLTPLETMLRRKLSELKSPSKNRTTSACFRLCNISAISSKSFPGRNFVSNGDIVALTETWDRPEFPDRLFAHLRSFNVFRKPRISDPHGGVCLVVRKAFKAFHLSDHESAKIDFLVVQLTLFPIIMGVFHLAPSRILLILPSLLEHNREKFSANDLSKFLCVGDFNLIEIDWKHKTSLSPHSSQFLLSLKVFV